LHQLVTRALATSRRRDFQVVHYSIQADHLHLIVEADDEKALASAMTSLAVRIAKRLNRLLGRRQGKVWDHRYHRRDLVTPSEVKHALAYVLGNWKKHGLVRPDSAATDPLSSGPMFDGWSNAPARAPPDAHAWRPPRARTWLLGVGWRARGLLSTTDAPRARRPVRAARRHAPV
jgi:REP element-mobilizing transposase RayT